jgi:phosphoglycerate kinase
MALFSNIYRLHSLDLAERRVFLRGDLNARLSGFGGVVDDSRLRAALPTLRHLLASRSKVVVGAHFGTPEEPAPSNAPRAVARRLSELLGHEVGLSDRDFWRHIKALEPGEIVLAPNLVEYPEECRNDAAFAAEIARSVDVYVGDDLRSAQNLWASVDALPRAVPSRGAGALLGSDLDMLELIAGTVPERPYVAVVGGSGFARRAALLWALLLRADALVLGGVVANTCLVARGVRLGASRYEADQVEAARAFLSAAEERGVAVHLPPDALVVRPEQGIDSLELRDIAALGPSEMIVDVGIRTCILYRDVIANAATLLWTGLLGIADREETQSGTYRAAQAVAMARHSLVFGERTVATLDALDLLPAFKSISRAGDAALSLMSGVILPGIESLRSVV